MSKMYKLFKSKRGIAIDDLIELVAAIIFFGFIIILLHINNVNQQKQMSVNIKNELNNIKAEKDLLNFLKTTIKIEEKEIDMADLIVLWNKEFTKAKVGEMIIEYRDKENNRYTETLVAEVKKFLSNLDNPCTELYPVYAESYPVYFKPKGGGGYSPPYTIASPKWQEGCFHNPSSSTVFVDIPSFNPPEGGELKTSSIRVVLEYKLSK